MSFENTLNRFKLVSGLSDEEAARWLPVLRESAEYVKGLVEKESLSQEEALRVDNAAGVYAYYRYALYSLRDENSFSAGDVRVYLNRNKAEEARLMWEDELSQLNDIALCSHFTFRGFR